MSTSEDKSFVMDRLQDYFSPQRDKGLLPLSSMSSSSLEPPKIVHFQEATLLHPDGHKPVPIIRLPTPVPVHAPRGATSTQTAEDNNLAVPAASACTVAGSSQGESAGTDVVGAALEGIRMAYRALMQAHTVVREVANAQRHKEEHYLAVNNMLAAHWKVDRARLAYQALVENEADASREMIWCQLASEWQASDQTPKLSTDAIRLQFRVTDILEQDNMLFAELKSLYAQKSDPVGDERPAPKPKMDATRPRPRLELPIPLNIDSTRAVGDNSTFGSPTITPAPTAASNSRPELPREAAAKERIAKLSKTAQEIRRKMRWLKKQAKQTEAYAGEPEKLTAIQLREIEAKMRSKKFKWHVATMAKQTLPYQQGDITAFPVFGVAYPAVTPAWYWNEVASAVWSESPRPSSFEQTKDDAYRGSTALVARGVLNMDEDLYHYLKVGEFLTTWRAVCHSDGIAYPRDVITFQGLAYIKAKHVPNSVETVSRKGMVDDNSGPLQRSSDIHARMPGHDVPAAEKSASGHGPPLNGLGELAYRNMVLCPERFGQLTKDLVTSLNLARRMAQSGPREWAAHETQVNSLPRLNHSNTPSQASDGSRDKSDSQQVTQGSAANVGASAAIAPIESIIDGSTELAKHPAIRETMPMPKRNAFPTTLTHGMRAGIVAPPMIHLSLTRAELTEELKRFSETLKLATPSSFTDPREKSPERSATAVNTSRTVDEMQHDDVSLASSLYVECCDQSPAGGDGVPQHGVVSESPCWTFNPSSAPYAEIPPADEPDYGDLPDLVPGDQLYDSMEGEAGDDEDDDDEDGDDEDDDDEDDDDEDDDDCEDESEDRGESDDEDSESDEGKVHGPFLMANPLAPQQTTTSAKGQSERPSRSLELGPWPGQPHSAWESSVKRNLESLDLCIEFFENEHNRSWEGTLPYYLPEKVHTIPRPAFPHFFHPWSLSRIRDVKHRLRTALEKYRVDNEGTTGSEAGSGSGKGIYFELPYAPRSPMPESQLTSTPALSTNPRASRCTAPTQDISSYNVLRSNHDIDDDRVSGGESSEDIADEIVAKVPIAREMPSLLPYDPVQSPVRYSVTGQSPSTYLHNSPEPRVRSPSRGRPRGASISEHSRPPSPYPRPLIPVDIASARTFTRDVLSSPVFQREATEAESMTARVARGMEREVEAPAREPSGARTGAGVRAELPDAPCYHPLQPQRPSTPCYHPLQLQRQTARDYHVNFKYYHAKWRNHIGAARTRETATAHPKEWKAKREEVREEVKDEPVVKDHQAEDGKIESEKVKDEETKAGNSTNEEVHDDEDVGPGSDWDQVGADEGSDGWSEVEALSEEEDS